jgi:hypothetical protein
MLFLFKKNIQKNNIIVRPLGIFLNFSKLRTKSDTLIFNLLSILIIQRPIYLSTKKRP